MPYNEKNIRKNEEFFLFPASAELNIQYAVDVSGVVVGPVAAGGIYDATQSYVSAFYMGGSLFIVCTIVMLLIPIVRNRSEEPKRDSAPEESARIVSTSRGAKKHGSIVKPAYLRKFAHQQALKTSKFNGDVEVHLQALEEIEEQMSNHSSECVVPRVSVTFAEKDDGERSCA